jgi:hypothetical protein
MIFTTAFYRNAPILSSAFFACGVFLSIRAILIFADVGQREVQVLGYGSRAFDSTVSHAIIVL